MSKPKPAPLPSGTVVGGYQVVKKLAAGGFGVVYLAEDAERHLVALKEYLPSSLAERSPGELTPRVKPEKQPLYRLGLKSFFEEGRSLAQISHPSVVSVLNFFRENETVYMVMNYLQGDTLQDFIVTARDLKRDKVFREIDDPLAVRRDPARLAHRAPAQDAAPRHQAGQHLHHQREQGGAARLRRRARGAVEGRQLHPPDVHAGLRRARDVPARRHARPVDRHLRDRRLHLRLHAGLSAERRAAADREGPPRAVSLSRLRNVYSDNLIEVTEWCMSLDPLSRPQSVFALQKELSRETERQYTKLSFSERLKLQLENLTASAKA